MFVTSLDQLLLEPNNLGKYECEVSYLNDRRNWCQLGNEKNCINAIRF